MSLPRATRLGSQEAPDFVKQWVSWGAGPRASQYLILGGKAWAILNGRYYVTTDDVRAVAHPVLRHRIITNYAAEAENIKADDIIDKLLETLPRGPEGSLDNERLPKVLGSANP